MNELDANFGDFDRKATAANNLRGLKQGKSTASEYASESRRICADLDWGKGAFVDQFKRGLSKEVKDLMLTVAVPSTLYEAISIAVRCDDRLRERQVERKEGIQACSHASRQDEPIPMELDYIGQRYSGMRRPSKSAEKRERGEKKTVDFIVEMLDIGYEIARR